MEFQIDNERRISNLEVEMKTCERRFSELKCEIKELGKVYEIIYTMTANMSVMSEQMIEVKKSIGVIEDRLEEVRWKPLSDASYYKRLVVGGVIGAIIVFLMGYVFGS